MNKFACVLGAVVVAACINVSFAAAGGGGGFGQGGGRGAGRGGGNFNGGGGFNGGPNEGGFQGGPGGGRGRGAQGNPGPGNVLGINVNFYNNEFDILSQQINLSDEQKPRVREKVDAMNAELQPLNSFVLPGGTPGAAYLHLARTVTRRAERLTCALAAEEKVNPEAIKYLNRLSDHLFVLGRRLNGNGASDVLWQPGLTRDDKKSA